MSLQVIAVGSGSTVPYVVERILQQGDEVNRKRKFIPTSFQAKELIVGNGLTLGDVEYVNISLRRYRLLMDYVVNTLSLMLILMVQMSMYLTILYIVTKIEVLFNRVDINLNAIKGGGACHLREKVLAEAARKFVIVADYRK